MKNFLIWCAVALVGFGGLGGGYHVALKSDPRRTLIIVDSSHPMADDWLAVPTILGKLERDRYTQFALMTEKGPVHGWQDEPALGRMIPYAPRSFAKLEADGQPLREEADEVILITNAPDDETDALSGMTILRVR